VDFITQLNILIENAGLLGAILLLLIVLLVTMVSMFTKRLKGLTDAIVILTNTVSKPYLDVQQSMFVYRAVASETINKVLKYAGDVLDRNSIQERREQIKINSEILNVVEIKKQNIICEEANKLSTINSVCGDMGQIIIKEADWPKILDGFELILFSEDPTKNKIQDIKLLLKESTDKFATIIQDSGIHNK
jgi:hypothetical protein